MLTFTLRVKTFFKLLINGKYKYVYASIRRRFIFYFNKEYFNSQLSKRKGDCAACSVGCCKIIISCCPYLENKRCSIYDKQPFFCKLFPIDEKDKELSDVKELCCYYFD